VISVVRSWGERPALFVDVVDFLFFLAVVGRKALTVNAEWISALKFNNFEKTRNLQHHT